MPRSKYDLNHITDTITENYIQLKENKLKVSRISGSHF
jgi:hypothetical protein